jgi:NlpB/DapX lipoprotein
MYQFRFFFAVFLAFSSVAYSVQVTSAEDEKVLPKLDGVSLQSEGSLYWLQFDEDADSLWSTLVDFWANEGITLKKEQPQLGYMETEWTKDLLVDRFLSVLLSDQAPERRERFRLRVERLPDNSGARVFINHSAYGILFDEEAVYTGYLPASSELELEMLSRLALYSGADQSKITQAVSSFAVADLQAEKINDNLYEIRVPGSVDFVQKKLLRALDRMNADTSTKADAVVATFNEKPVLGVSDDAHWGIDDSSDLEETGFPDQDVDDGKPAHIVYQMTLSKDKASAVVAVSAQPGNSDDGNGLFKFSRALARDLQGK